VVALLYSQVSCHHGRRGRRIRLSGEARVERRLRASVKVRREGRPSTLDRSIGRRGLSAAPPCSQAPSSMSGECLELRVGRSEILTATAHESGHSVTIRSNSPVNTSQLFSQGAGEANLLRLRDTDREHYVEVCVLAPQVVVDHYCKRSPFDFFPPIPHRTRAREEFLRKIRKEKEIVLHRPCNLGSRLRR
jgi:hypothetical protein